MNTGSASAAGLNPDAPTETRQDPPTDRQAHAGTGIGILANLPKWLEYVFKFGRRDAIAVVADRKMTFSINLSRTNLDFERHLGIGIGNGVVEQVHEHQSHLFLVGKYGR